MEARVPPGRTGRRAQVLEPLQAVLLNGVEPRPRDAILSALLSASGNLYLMRDDIPWSGDVQRRGRELEKGDWGAREVSRAVAAAAAAVSVAAVASTAAIASTQ